MNIVLDTNSLIMSIAPRSPYRNVWNAFLRGDYNLCVSNEIIEEYSEVLSRNAKCIVTEDKHFKVLENIPFPKVEVIGIEDFKCYLEKWI